MTNSKKINITFFTGLTGPVTANVSVESEKNIKNTTQSKINSLAYLAYKSRKQKGLITNDSECPTIYFGDEWAL